MKGLHDNCEVCCCCAKKGMPVCLHPDRKEVIMLLYLDGTLHPDCPKEKAEPKHHPIDRGTIRQAKADADAQLSEDK